MSYSRAAVMGAGAMGAGIARVLAASMNVVLIDIAIDLVGKGIQRIDAGLAGDLKKGRIAPVDKDRIMARTTGSVDIGSASGADLVIEAVVEDKNVKGELLSRLNRVCPPDAVFATNTSTLSVAALGALSGRPGRFVGLHFFNPAHAMKLVEVVPGLDSERGVVDSMVAEMKALGKIPVVVQDCPGFLVNRVLLAYVGEALLCAEEGVPPEEIDGEARKAGFPMGPLELSDMVGWDVSLHTLPILYRAYGERFPFPEIVRKLNDAGRLGVKTGKGIYTEGRVDDGFRAMVRDLRREKCSTPFSINRPIVRAVNEAVYCLQEGVASAEDIDRAMVLGTGFPNRAGVGGPLRWADEKGLDWVVGCLEELAGWGERFRPHHMLRTYVSAGRCGKRSQKGFFAH